MGDWFFWRRKVGKLKNWKKGESGFFNTENTENTEKHRKINKFSFVYSVVIF